MKTVILNVRIPEELMDALIEKSLDNDVSNSVTVRNILSNHFENHQEVEIYNNSKFQQDLYDSNEFLFLTTWIFQKKGQQEVNTEKHILIELKNIVIQVIEENSLPEYLIDEFQNVLLVDLIRVINNYNSENNQFRFCKLYEDYTFDFSGLSEYITSKVIENIIQL